MRKKIVIVLLVLLSCTGVFLLLKISTWHAVFLFSEKDLEWLAPYHDGDMVFYTSPTGMDTMIVSRNLYNAPGLLGLYCFSNFYAEGEYINTIYHNGDRIDCELIIVKESDDYVNLMIDFDKRFSEDELQVDETSTVIVKGRVYNDAIILYDAVEYEKIINEIDRGVNSFNVGWCNALINITIALKYIEDNDKVLMLYSQREKISSYADKCINEILTCNNNNVKANFINGISGVSFALSILLRLSPTQLKRT
jgi:hypothetical protein